MIYMLSDWPTQSPDLNMINPLSSELKAGVFTCKSENIVALRRACEEQLANIPVLTKKIFMKAFLVESRRF